MAEAEHHEVIITGAGGAIGRQLTDYLLSRDFSLALNYLTEREVPAHIRENKNVRLVVGDICAHSVLQNLISDNCSIVHLASSVDPALYARKLTDGFVKGVQSTLALLDYLKETACAAHLVFPSSGGTVYSDSGQPHLENEYVCGSSVYGISKLMLENQIILLCKSNPRLSANILRISNPYGMNLNKNRKQGFVDVALQKFIDGEDIEVWSDVNTIRDYIHYEDLNRAFEKALAYRRGAEIFNIGSGEGHSLADILEMMRRLSVRKVCIRYCSSPCASDYPACNILNIDKAARILGFRPQVNFEDGLARAFAEKGKRNE